MAHKAFNAQNCVGGVADISLHQTFLYIIISIYSCPSYFVIP